MEALQEKKTELYSVEIGTINEKQVEEIDKKIAANLLKIQRETFEAELESIREMKSSRGRSAAIFNTKDKIVGKKATAPEAVVLFNPRTKEEVNTANDIKKVSLQYCTDLLTNRKPKVQYEEDILMKELIHEIRMQEVIKDDIEELTISRFDETYDALAKKPGSKYQFIMKGGADLKAALFKLCQVVWRTEVQPDRWAKSTLVQLYKGRGLRSILDNHRHLHIKDEFPKFFGHLVVAASKDKMIENMSKFQIGTKPGHRAQEHLFVLKSVIALYLHYNIALILSMWDVSKFFDREALADCMNELYKNKVQGKLYRLLFEMNKNTKISIQTPVGLTEEKDTGQGVGQGTLEGALVSAVNLDNGVGDMFHDSEYEVSYGDVDLRPLLYQDDVARLAHDIESAQMGNDKMETMAETKLLDFNLDKSCFIVVGNKKKRQEIQDKLALTPLQLCGSDMKQEEQAKYLGDYLSHLGLAGSVAATVNKRKGLVTKSIFEIRTVVEDCRSQVCGGLTAGLDIWELAVIPMLINNAECWLEISSKTIQDLENLQLLFYRCLLAVGTGCPIPSLYWETGGLLMKYRIIKKKLLFLHHVTNLPNCSLAKEILDVQKRLALPGLAQECQEWLVKFDIGKIENYSKYQWKKLIKQKILKQNKYDILSQIKSYKKLNYEDYKNQELKVQPYLHKLNISQARMRFKIKSLMTPTVRMNFPSDPGYTLDLWRCVGCSSDGDPIGYRDTQRHIIACHGYAALRQEKDMNDDRDLVIFFQQVIKQRQDTE